MRLCKFLQKFLIPLIPSSNKWALQIEAQILLVEHKICRTSMRELNSKCFWSLHFEGTEKQKIKSWWTHVMIARWLLYIKLQFVNFVIHILFPIHILFVLFFSRFQNIFFRISANCSSTEIYPCICNIHPALSDYSFRRYLKNLTHSLMLFQNRILG